MRQAAAGSTSQRNKQDDISLRQAARGSRSKKRAAREENSGAGHAEGSSPCCFYCRSEGNLWRRPGVSPRAGAETLGVCSQKSGRHEGISPRAFKEPDTRHNRYRCFLSDLAELAALPPPGSFCSCCLYLWQRPLSRESPARAKNGMLCRRPLPARYSGCPLQCPAAQKKTGDIHHRKGRGQIHAHNRAHE